MKSITLILSAVIGRAAMAAGAVTVSSLNGDVRVEVPTDDSDSLIWSVERKGKPIISESPLGLTVDGQQVGESVTLGKSQTRTINEIYPIYGNHSTPVNHCTETAIPVSPLTSIY